MTTSCTHPENFTACSWCGASSRPMNIVVIDDERTFVYAGEVTYLRSSAEALDWIARWYTDCRLGVEDPTIDELWLDHDLGGEDTIVPVAKFLKALSLEGPLPIERIYVHSQNPVGGDNVMDTVMLVGQHNALRVSPPELEQTGTMACAIERDQGFRIPKDPEILYAKAVESLHGRTRIDVYTDNGDDERYFDLPMDFVLDTKGI